MDAVLLRENFKRYLAERFPNDNYIGVHVSDAFYLIRHEDDFGMKFEQILADGFIPETYRPWLEERFTKRGVQNPRGNAAGYEKAFDLLLDYYHNRPYDQQTAPKTLPPPTTSIDTAQLRKKFQAHMQQRFPKNPSIGSTVSGAFFLERKGNNLGFDFQQIIVDGIIPETYRAKIQKYFESRGRKNPRGDAYIYERSLRLLLEFISGNELPMSKPTPPPITVPPTEKAIMVQRVGKWLVKMGLERFAQKSEHPWVHLTGKDEYDAVLNDLENTPHAFVLACLMDRGVKAERAWAVPCIVMAKYGANIHSLNAVSEDEYISFFQQNSLHRFHREMAVIFKGGVQRIVEKFDGDASLMWKGKPGSKTAVNHFLAFRGAGEKIATMAVNILVRQFQIELADFKAIDVSPDVHICRVMYRMGLIESDKDTRAAIRCARELHPDFPGIIDFSLWEIGRNYCKAKNPLCGECIVKNDCVKRLGGEVLFRDPPAQKIIESIYSEDELSEALRAIKSLIGKCEKAYVQLIDSTPQHTLMQRRLAALKISADLIEKEMSNKPDIV
ncbi:MAG: hypothetical protein FWE06_03120 [Oscillospiraceae bacterium]|nr:hypothetical protein [Oscillospiraceae bacterium]